MGWVLDAIDAMKLKVRRLCAQEKKSDLSFTHYFFALTLFYFLLSGPGPVHPQGDHPASGDRK